jgi:hypothetical protein
VCAVGDFRTLPEKRKEKEIIRSLEPDATKKKRKEKEKQKKMESCQTTPGKNDNSLQLMCLKGMQTSIASSCLFLDAIFGRISVNFKFEIRGSSQSVKIVCTGRQH